MTLQHQSLASGTWHTLTLSEQLANIGSEFYRTSKAFEAQNTQRFNAAFRRLYELLSLTLTDLRWNDAVYKEVCRLKEAICMEFWGENPTKKSRDALDKYFTYFARLIQQKKTHKIAS